MSTTLWTSTGCTHSAIESIDTVGERARGNYPVREVIDSDSVAVPSAVADLTENNEHDKSGTNRQFHMSAVYLY